MAIDITREKLISFGEAAKLLPTGSRPSYVTWWRWWRCGVRGIRLDTVRVGGKRFTSTEAMQRFVVAVSGHSQRPNGAARKRRDRDERIAMAELHAEGILERPSEPTRSKRG